MILRVYLTAVRYYVHAVSTGRLLHKKVANWEIQIGSAVLNKTSVPLQYLEGGYGCMSM